ncbi:response regulator transcription factor [Candidatus Wolfebacteria bacterium]|nr:response regulator transcription factor [Candidatus Wolfebacteria bacterium]
MNIFYRAKWLSLTFPLSRYGCIFYCSYDDILYRQVFGFKVQFRILIVEDEKAVANFLKVGFEAECFAVDVVQDGEMGSYLARTNDYDLIILDNILPKKNGQIVCEEIRKDNKTTPVIMLSVKSDTFSKIDLLNAGADDYLTKPFSFEELLARVRALLRRPKNMGNEILKFDDLEVDTKRHIIKRGGKEIYLTKKEFALLVYLMRSPDIVISRSMLMEHVWDMNADPFSNTIESHILSLRRKIDVRGRKKIIRTMPGRGYKISLH